ncbi:hypothetical protein [Bacillus sp. 37MA]|uniref:hypothetical protein n=1 Tax=Bacillus sp. 37MA TaxID=1132442 RepID=UPI00036A41B1|nr:hypothetical protein [Bacillus sp. 37MA]
MENLLRKSVVYSFFIGIGIAILAVNYKEVINLGEGVTQTSYLPVAEYIITVLRCGVVASILGLIWGLLLYNRIK